MAWVQIQLHSLFVTCSVAWLVEASVERIRSLGFEPQSILIFFSDNQFCGYDQDESVNLVKRYLDLINVVVSCTRMLDGGISTLHRKLEQCS